MIDLARLEAAIRADAGLFAQLSDADQGGGQRRTAQ